MKIYVQVKEKALPFIEAYHKDLLVHDKGVMDRNPKMPFVHFTHNCGTHLITLCPFEYYPATRVMVPFCFAEAGRDHILHEKMSLVKHFEQPEYGGLRLLLHYNGKKLIAIDLAKAREIVTEYQRQMRVTFHQDNGHGDEITAKRKACNAYDMFPM